MRDNETVKFERNPEVIDFGRAICNFWHAAKGNALKTCDHCGATVSDNAKFCRKCGARQLQSVDRRASWTCKKCGFVVQILPSRPMRLCPRCGVQIATMHDEVAVDVPRTETSGEQTLETSLVLRTR